MPIDEPAVYAGLQLLHPRRLDYSGLRIEIPTPKHATSHLLGCARIHGRRRVALSLHFRGFIMRYGSPPEAPLHLGTRQMPPPEWLPAEDFHDDDPPTHAVPTREYRRSAQNENRRRSRPRVAGTSGEVVTSARDPRRVVVGPDLGADGVRDVQRLARSSHEAAMAVRALEADEHHDIARVTTPTGESTGLHVRSRSRDSSRSSSTGARDPARSAGASSSSRSPSRHASSSSSSPARDASSSSGSPSRESSSLARSSSSPAHSSTSSSRSARGSQPAIAPRVAVPVAEPAPDMASPLAAALALLAQQGGPAITPEMLAVLQAQLAQHARPSDAAMPARPSTASEPVAAVEGTGTVDPLAVVVPPELGTPIYSWVRRLALQADLAGADRVLRDAFLDLTSSLSVAIIYPGEDGLWTLGADDEIPADAAPVVAVANARRALIASHQALIPIVTTTEAVAVVVLTRNPRNPAYHPIEQIAMVGLARESAAILHHLAVAHLQRADEIKADRGGLYRGEALEAHRSRGNEGVPVNLSPSWVKRTYPLLVATLLIAVFCSIFITVPTYSSGMGVVALQGTTITAPTAGTVEQVLVKTGQQVVKGTVLVRLHSAEQDAELQQAQTDADNLTIQYLFDPSDEQVKKTLATALARVDREKARVETRLVRARESGTVSDIRVRVGMLLQPGSHVLQIVDPASDPEIWAFLPGKDRPRLREGQTLQVELVGYTKSREKARIYHVTPEVLGPTEAAKIVGEQLADSIKLAPGSYVWVRAKLPGKKFVTSNREYWYHHGMPAKTEIKVQSKPFLVTLLPALEKYLPD